MEPGKGIITICQIFFFSPFFGFYFLCQFTLIPLFAWGRVVISGASSVISFATGSEIQNVRRRPRFLSSIFFFLFFTSR